jgi:hypothetical protein
MPETQKNNFNWGFCDFLYINKNVLWVYSKLL